MSPVALGRLICAATILIESVASARSSSSASPRMLVGSAAALASRSSAITATTIGTAQRTFMRPGLPSEAAEHAHAVPMIGQNLEQVAFAQTLLDAAPPFGRQDLAMGFQEHVPEVGVEAEEAQERLREDVV